MWPSTTAGSSAVTKVEMTTNDQNLMVLDFDPAAVEAAEFSVVMPSDWNGGTLTARFYWFCNSATANAVVWGCEGRSYADGEAIDQAWGAQVTVTDANASVPNQMRVSALSAPMTVAGTPAAGEYVQFRIKRMATDGADTLAVDARLVAVMIGFIR